MSQHDNEESKTHQHIRGNSEKVDDYNKRSLMDDLSYENKMQEKQVFDTLYWYFQIYHPNKLHHNFPVIRSGWKDN
jgi:hypothetical protein